MRKGELQAVIELIKLCREYDESVELIDICDDVYAMLDSGELDEHYDVDDLNERCKGVQVVCAMLDGDDR